jgi:hypothetical protein
MQILTGQPPPMPTRIRAIVEIVDGKLKVCPVADSDAERIVILNELRFIRRGFLELR